MTVHELSYRMPASELAEWVEYSRVEPFNVAEVQMAGLLSMVSSYLGGSAGPEEFMVSRAAVPIVEESVPITGEALESYLKGII